MQIPLAVDFFAGRSTGTPPLFEARGTKSRRLRIGTASEDVLARWKNSDQMGKFVIFDINQDKFRLVCAIRYDWKMVYIRGVHVDVLRALMEANGLRQKRS